MKYYIYISDTKVNMLYEQIPPRLRDKLAVELKIDLKFLSVSFSEDSPEIARFTRTQIVTDFIERNYNVGKIDAPSAYFRGSLSLRWGILGRQLVYFGGMTGKTVLGMTGSLEHVIGNPGSSDVQFPNRPSSSPVGLLDVIRRELRHPTLTNKNHSGNSQDLADIAFAARTLDGPEQKLEFLAKRLMEGDEPTKNPDMFGKTGKRVLLGSPIYVALEE